MLSKTHKPRKMLLCSLLLLALSLASASNKEQQVLRCGRRRHDVCDDLDSLRTEVDVNTADRRKWNKYFQFVQRFQRSWEDDVASAVSSIMEKLPPAGDTKLTDELLKENRHLRGEMMALQEKMHDLETSTLNLRAELAKEKEARNKIESKVKETLPSLFLTIPGNFTENFGEMQNVLGGLSRKVESLEMQESASEEEVEKQRDELKKLKSSISRIRSSTLTIAQILITDAPSREADIIFKGVIEPLQASNGDLERDISHTFPYRNFTTGISNSKELEEMKSKLGQLETNMKILTDSFEKAMSNIKVLENKYSEAMRAQVRPDRRQKPGPNYEFVQKHRNSGDRRPFDPERDP